MRVAILDDIHRAYEGTAGVRRLRERAEVRIFTGPFGEAAALRGSMRWLPTASAHGSHTRLAGAAARAPHHRPDGNHAYHIDLAAAAQRGVIVASASGGSPEARLNWRSACDRLDAPDTNGR